MKYGVWTMGFLGHSGIGSVVLILYSSLFFVTCDLRRKSEKWRVLTSRGADPEWLLLESST
jgi:hypothetical protein